LVWTLCALFLGYWIFGWFFNHNMENWIIENLLVILAIPFLIWTYRHVGLSDLSCLLIFLFLVLHCYGAYYAYTSNALGEWLKAQYSLTRNPYDRIVHFSFGLLLAYPIREWLIKRSHLTGRPLYLRPIEILFALGTVFELIEWFVAEYTSPATGETYVATQGDVWDAHKDIALAGVGAAITMLVLYFAKRIKK
jgi:putative membrane protein